MLYIQCRPKRLSFYRDILFENVVFPHVYGSSEVFHSNSLHLTISHKIQIKFFKKFQKSPFSTIVAQGRSLHGTYSLSSHYEKHKSDQHGSHVICAEGSNVLNGFVERGFFC